MNARLAPADIELLADLIAERLAGGVLPARLVGVGEVARYLGVEESYVYEHATALGARRLGSGPRARLRFGLQEVDRLLSCYSGKESGKPAERMVDPIRRRRRPARLGTTRTLLPIKGHPGAENA